MRDKEKDRGTYIGRYGQKKKKLSLIVYLKQHISTDIKD